MELIPKTLSHSIPVRVVFNDFDIIQPSVATLNDQSSEATTMADLLQKISVDSSNM